MKVVGLKYETRAKIYKNQYVGGKKRDKRNGKSDSLDIRSSAEVSRKTLQKAKDSQREGRVEGGRVNFR